MQSGILKYEGNTLHINRLGQGSKLLFAFHGFDHEASIFQPLEKKLGQQYTIIVIELPGLGRSEWNNKKIDKVALVTIIERFKLEFKVDKIDLLGMGLGALYTLTLMEQRGEWIENVLLFAPEGLRRKSWQRAITLQSWPKSRIAKAISMPEKKEKILKSLVNWSWIKKEHLPMVEEYISKQDVKTKWDKTFPLHFVLVPEIQKVRYNVHKNKIRVQFFVPEDLLIMKKDAFKFTKKQTSVKLDFETAEHFGNPSWIIDTAVAFFNPK